MDSPESGQGVDFHVDPVAPTTEATAHIAGIVQGQVHLSVLAQRGGTVFFETTVDIEGAWSLNLTGLPYGHSEVRLFADSGHGVARMNLTIVRLTSIPFEVVYASYPLHSDSRDEVAFDLDGMASAPAYEGRDVAHPPHATVHDLMTTWSHQTGLVVDYDYGAGFGYAAIRFDGVGQPLDSAAPPYWCYKVNGDYAKLGLSLQEVVPGDTVTWDYGTCG